MGNHTVTEVGCTDCTAPSCTSPAQDVILDYATGPAGLPLTALRSHGAGFLVSAGGHTGLWGASWPSVWPVELSGFPCLQDEIQDFEALFVGQRLTPKEQEELAYKKTVLELALKRKAAQDELNQDDDYHIPQAYDAPGRHGAVAGPSWMTADSGATRQLQCGLIYCWQA